MSWDGSENTCLLDRFLDNKTKNKLVDGAEKGAACSMRLIRGDATMDALYKDWNTEGV